MLATLEDGGLITTEPGECPACLEEPVLFPWRGKSVTCMSLRLQQPSIDWALALCLWVLSTQPGPSCLSLLFHVHVYFILYLHAFLCICLQQFIYAQEKIIKAYQPVRQALPLSDPPYEFQRGTPHQSSKVTGPRAVLQLLLTYDRRDSHEWDTFSFSSWLLRELSKQSLLP